MDQLPEIVFAHLAIYFHIGVSEMQAGFRVSQATPSWLCSYGCFDSWFWHAGVMMVAQDLPLPWCRLGAAALMLPGGSRDADYYKSGANLKVVGRALLCTALQWLSLHVSLM